MRRVADELGVSPMGLYRRVATRDDLAASSTKPLTRLSSSPSSASREVQLRSVFLSVHRTLLAHPGLIAILTSQSISTTRAMRAVEHCLPPSVTPVQPRRRHRRVSALQSYTFGFTVQQRAHDADQRSHLTSPRALPADDYPQFRCNGLQCLASTHSNRLTGCYGPPKPYPSQYTQTPTRAAITMRPK